MNLLANAGTFRVQEGGFSFTEQDLRAVETFGLFCGLGIHNSQMYEHACKYRILDTAVGRPNGRLTIYQDTLLGPNVK